MATTAPQNSVPENVTAESETTTQQTPEPVTNVTTTPTTIPTTTTTPTTTEAITTTTPNTPSSTATEPKPTLAATKNDGPGLGPIIGGAVGGVVVVAAIVIIVILCRKRRKPKPYKATPLPPNIDYVEQVRINMLNQEQHQTVESPEQTDKVLYQNVRDTGIPDVQEPQLDADGYLKKTSTTSKGLGGAYSANQNGQGLSPSRGIEGQATVRCDIELRNGDDSAHIYGNQEVAVAYNDDDIHIYGNEPTEAVYTNEIVDRTNAHAHVANKSVISKPAAETSYVNTRRSDSMSEEDYEVVERPDDGKKDGTVGPKYSNVSQHAVNSEQQMYELP